MKKQKIFVVDDEPELLDLYRSILEAAYDLSTFLKPSELVGVVESGNVPDILVTDMNMPEMSGVQLLSWVRRNRIKCPAILISGYSDKPLMNQVMKLGGVQLIEKPFSVDYFKGVVHNAVVCAVFQQLQSDTLKKLKEIIHAFSTLEQGVDGDLYSAGLSFARQQLSELILQENEIEKILYTQQDS